MPKHSEDPSHDYWSGDVVEGLSSTWVFEGEDGLERLSGPAAYSSTSPKTFRARLTRVQVDHVALEAFVATPFRSERDRQLSKDYPTPILTFLLLAEGELHVTLPHASFELGPGDSMIVDSRDPMTASAPTDVRMLLSVIGIEHIPAHLRLRRTTIPAPLRRTTMTDGFIAFASSVLRSASTGRPTSGSTLIRAVADLQIAVLAEAQQLTEEPKGLAALRYLMEDYIEAHITDPGLSPGTIAQALGISVRHAHAVFNDSDRTIARFIRDRRISAIALELRVGADRLPQSELAARYGFANAESMSRAFRNRVGLSPSEYRAGGHRHLATASGPDPAMGDVTAIW